MGSGCGCVCKKEDFENKNELLSTTDVFRKTDYEITSDSPFKQNFKTAKDNLLKEIFNKINDIRFNPFLFIEKAKKYGIQDVINEANEKRKNGNDISLFLYGDEKYVKLFDVPILIEMEQTSNNEFSTPTKSKRIFPGTDYLFDDYCKDIQLINCGSLEDLAEHVLLTLISRLDKNQQKDFLMKNYKHCNVTAVEKTSLLIEFTVSFIYKEKSKVFD